MTKTNFYPQRSNEPKKIFNYKRVFKFLAFILLLILVFGIFTLAFFYFYDPQIECRCKLGKIFYLFLF